MKTNKRLFTIIVLSIFVLAHILPLYNYIMQYLIVFRQKRIQYQN